MKHAVMLIALFAGALTTAATNASGHSDLMEFDVALEAYRDGRHDQARAGFRHLAELGDTRARYNLGVMLLKGEGGPAETAEGLAWISWSAEEDHEPAAAALSAAHAALDHGDREQAGTILETLRAEHALAAILARPDPDDDMAGSRARRCIERVNPHYPRKAAGQRRIGYSVVHLLISPEGHFDAVDAEQTLVRDDPFAGPATSALRRWSARACPPDDYRYAVQVILFDLDRRDGYAPATRAWVEDALARAAAGDPGAAYAVATLDHYQRDLVGLAEGERAALMRQAAVAGLPEARAMLAQWLQRRAPEHAARWRQLAAAQGHGPSLLGVALRSEGNVRRDSLRRAAETGFLPAVLLAVRELATHPDPAHRDGTAALRLTRALPREVLRRDTAMIEAHAAALAENGRFDEAQDWQKRALRAARRAGRDTEAVAQRLLEYAAQRPWRDSELLSPRRESSAEAATTR